MNEFSPEFFDSTQRRFRLSLEEIQRAIDTNGILEFKVASYSTDRSLVMHLGDNIIGIIPFNELEYRDDNKPTSEKTAMFKTGKHVKFIPTSIAEDANGVKTVACSRRLAQKKCKEEFIDKLTPGDVIDAKVINFEKYGIFCDIGCGISALLPFGHISVVNSKDIKETIYANDLTLRVIVRTNINNRIVLSHRELLGTWEQNINELDTRENITGIVVNKQPYGTFIKISQNLAGLADVNNSLDSIEEGDYVSVDIISIQSDQMKVKLSVKNKVDNNSVKYDKFKYYFNTGDHITNWIYTVESYHKIIGTDFTRTNDELERFNNSKSKGE